jgi:acetylcholinesterase
VTATVRAGNFTKVAFLTGGESQALRREESNHTVHIANLDEGASFGPRGIDNDTALVNALQGAFPHLTNSSITKLLELYPNDPSVGCPYNTSDGILSTGRQDKRSFSIVGDTAMHAGVRGLLS